MPQEIESSAAKRIVITQTQRRTDPTAITDAVSRVIDQIPVGDLSVANGVATMTVHNSVDLQSLQRLLGNDFIVWPDRPLQY